MNYRHYAAILVLVVMGDWLASLVMGAEPAPSSVRLATPARPKATAPRALPPLDPTMRSISDILPLAPLAPSAPVAESPAAKQIAPAAISRPAAVPEFFLEQESAPVVNRADWSAEPSRLELPAVRQVAGEVPTSPAGESSLSQRLKAIRDGQAPPAATDEPRTLAAPGANQFAPVPLDPGSTDGLPAALPSSRATVPAATNPAEAPAAGVPAATSSRRPIVPNAATPAATAAEPLLSGRSPQLRVEAIGPKTVLVGKPAAYVVNVVNGPAAAAAGIEVIMDLPPSAGVEGQRVTVGDLQVERTQEGLPFFRWRIAELATNAKAQLSFNLAVADARPFDLRVEWVTQSQIALARVEAQEAKLELVVTGPREMNHGERKSFTVSVSNPGNGPAENVVLILPPGLAGEAGAEKKIGTLPPGERKDITLDVSPREGGALKLIVEARGERNLAAAAVHEVSVHRAQLQVRMEGPRLKYTGTQGVYRVHVQNAGDCAAEGVTLNVVAPAGVTLQSATEGGKIAAGRSTWTLGRLAPGATRAFDLRCEMTTAGEASFEAIASGGGELVASTTMATNIEAVADLKLEVNDPQGPIVVGEMVRYEIRLVNRGSKVAPGVRIMSFFSEGLEPLKAEGAPGKLQPGQVVFEPLAGIEPGQQLVLYVDARADRAGEHRFRAEIEYGTPAVRLAAEDSTRFFEDDAGPVGGSPAPSVSRKPAFTTPSRR